MGEHERAHVAFLRDALGGQAEPKPTFDFGNTTRNRDRFVATAAMLEDTAVAAYNGQAVNLTKPVAESSGDDRLGRGAARGVDPRHRRPARVAAGNG